MLVKIVNLELLSRGPTGCITDKVIHYSHYNHILISFSGSFTMTHQITIIILEWLNWFTKEKWFYTLNQSHPILVCKLRKF